MGKELVILLLALSLISIETFKSYPTTPLQVQLDNEIDFAELVLNGNGTVKLLSHFLVPLRPGDRLIFNEDGSSEVSRMSAGHLILFGIPVNINTASLDDLTAFSGIGKKKARQIIDYRESSGGFKSLEELERVPGIGRKTVNKIAIYLTI